MQNNKYYKYCINCHKQSFGKPFCDICYEHYNKLSPREKYLFKYKDNHKETKTIEEENQPKLKRKCAYCGNDAFDSEFCENCFNKYFNYKPISQNHETKIFNGYKLKNGIIVKSKSELIIGTFLINHHIKFEYEKAYKYAYNKKPLKPDFYIEGPHLFKGKWLKNIYIEHFGGAKSNDPEEQEIYHKIVEYKIPIYKQGEITLICTYEEDLTDIETKLTEKLKYHSKGMINYSKES